MSATTGAGYKPMNQQLNNVPFNTAFAPAATPMVGQPVYPQMVTYGVERVATSF